MIGYLEYHDEQLPLWIDGMVAGCIDATAEIRFSSRSDWRITGLYIDGHNGRTGEQARSVRKHLRPDHNRLLWDTLMDSFLRCDADIADAIGRHIEQIAA